MFPDASDLDTYALEEPTEPEKAVTSTTDEAAPGTTDEAAPGTEEVTEEALTGLEGPAEEPMETGAESDKEDVKEAVTKETVTKEAEKEVEKEASDPAEPTIDGSPVKKMKVAELKVPISSRQSYP